MLYSTKPWHFIWKPQFSNMNISFCHFHLHFLWCSPTHQKYSARAHKLPKLRCCTATPQTPNAELTTGDRWPKQREILKFPTFPARAGLAQRLEGPSAWSGIPWGSLKSNAAPGLQVLHLSLAALPSAPACSFSLWPSRRHCSAWKSRTLLLASPSWQWWKNFLIPLRGIKGPNQEWGFHLKFLSVMEITEAAELQISAVHYRGRLGFQVIESQILKLGKDL